jgi:hypothetical protein
MVTRSKLRIVFALANGVLLFREYKFTTADIPVPRVGDDMRDGNTLYCVKSVTWDYRYDSVFIEVRKYENG